MEGHSTGTKVNAKSEVDATIKCEMTSVINEVPRPFLCGDGM